MSGSALRRSPLSLRPWSCWRPMVEPAGGGQTPPASESRCSSRRRSVRSRLPQRTRRFPARGIADFVRRWGFFDPNPFLLRRDWSGLDSSRLDHYGRNLGETLHALASSAPEVVDRIRSATQNIVGLPAGIETRESEDRVLFRAVGAWSPILCPSDGSVQWDIAYAGTDDRAPRRAGNELAGNRGAGELHPPERSVCLRRVSSGIPGPCTVHGDDPLASAARSAGRSEFRMRRAT